MDYKKEAKADINNQNQTKSKSRRASKQVQINFKEASNQVSCTATATRMQQDHPQVQTRREATATDKAAISRDLVVRETTSRGMEVVLAGVIRLHMATLQRAVAAFTVALRNQSTMTTTQVAMAHVIRAARARPKQQLQRPTTGIQV